MNRQQRRKQLARARQLMGKLEGEINQYRISLAQVKPLPGFEQPELFVRFYDKVKDNKNSEDIINALHELTSKASATDIKGDAGYEQATG